MTSKPITTPDVGAEDVTVIEILVKVGDTIAKEASIVTLESDKATMEVPSTENGVVKEIKVKVGDKVNNGSVLMTVETKEESKTEAKDESKTEAKEENKKETKTETVKDKSEKKSNKKNNKIKEKKVEKESEEVDEAIETEEDKPTVLSGTVESDEDVHAGPGVRRMARELGVNLQLVSPSGPKKRVVKEDVDSFVKTQLASISGKAQNQSLMSLNFPSAPAVDFSKFGKTELYSLSRIKKISGKNLQRNWMMIPHVTQFGEADITTLEEFRQSQKKVLEKQKIKLTPLVFIMKAVVAGLKSYPHMNASLDASGENLILKKYFNIGVAVDTPDGLIVPVIRDVDKKSLTELAKELAEISEKARKKQLTPADLQGGCFSISSLGGIGGTAFTPIINAPEVAILGVSKSYFKPVYEEGEFVPRLMLPLSLSYDHRVIDGADGARFIVHLSEMLSDIRNLLL